MHLFNRRPHDGSSSIIQIGEGLDTVEVEILEVIGDQVIVGVFAPAETPVQRKEVALERQRAAEEATLKEATPKEAVLEEALPPATGQ